jgi:RND family efflux transporter MFP subunit
MNRTLPLITAILAAGMLSGCREQQLIEKSARPVRVQAVEQQGSQTRARYTANIAPYEQLALAFRTSGYVREVRQVQGADGRMRNLQEGDRVSAHTVLARVNDSDYLENVNSAKANLAGAQAAFEKSKLDFERAERLFKSESLTKTDYDAAHAGLDTGRARVDGAKAQLAEAEIRLSDTQLVAPAAGVILERKIEMGSLVSPGMVGFVLADTRSVKAVFGIPDWLAGQARLGMVLPVTIEPLGARTISGRLTSISPHADTSSRLFEVELTIPNPLGILKPGFIATVVVPEGNPAAARAEAEALVVPLAAVVKPPQGTQFSVFVVEGQGAKQVAHLRSVEVGEVYGNMVAVRKGLQRGERVVVTGASLLADNEAVQVIP